jgi:hypothetical protein
VCAVTVGLRLVAGVIHGLARACVAPIALVGFSILVTLKRGALFAMIALVV